MAIVTSVEPGDLNFEEVLDLYDSVGWTAYTKDPQRLEAALHGSSSIVQARAGSQLVGLARTISDGASICYLQDLLVRPSSHRQGIGRALVTEALSPYAHVRQKVLLTDDEPKQKKFYESLGYTDTANFDRGQLRAFIRFD